MLITWKNVLFLIFDLLQVVYVARNQKDVAVSFYHQQRLVKSAEYVGSFREYILDFWCQDHRR